MKIISAFTLMLFFVTYSSYSQVTVLTKPAKKGELQLDKVLIVALTNDYNLRKMVEEQLSYEMRQMDYHVFSSVNVNEAKRELYTRDELIQLVEEKSLDGVIIIRLVDVESRERYSSNALKEPYTLNDFFYYTTTFTNVYNWSYEPEKTVTVETALYEAKTRNMVYSAEATNKNSTSQEDGVRVFAQKFAKAYRASGILKKK